MKRAIAALCLMLGFIFGDAEPARAVEHWNAAAATLPACATRSGSTFTLTDCWAKYISLADASVTRGKALKATVVITSYAAGQLEAYANSINQTSCTGAWENNEDGLNGKLAIADNFNINDAIVSSTPDFDPAFGGIDNRESDANGSFRFAVNPAKGKVARDDPMVCPGQPGRSHLHFFFGCNNAIDAYSTYRSLRLTGYGCGDDKAPGNRSAYWIPAMLDGAGGVIPMYDVLVYYKTIPNSRTECNPPLVGGVPDLSSGNYVGYCVPIPNGLKFIIGASMTDMSGVTSGGQATAKGGPEDTTSSFYGSLVYACGDNTGSVPKPGTAATYTNLSQVRAAGCSNTSGDFLYAAITAQPCWDGLHIDSPNHMDHVSKPVGNVILSGAHDTPIAPWTTSAGDAAGPWPRCPQTHPYQFPGPSIQWRWKLDKYWDLGKWHLSSDEQMGMAMAPGATLHWDYWEAWSPTLKAMWHGDKYALGPNGGLGTGCINGRNNCNFGMLGNGFKIKDLGGHLTASYSVSKATLHMPTNRNGWSKLFSGNGTKVAELRVDAGGEIGIYTVGGFTGQITVSFTDVADTGKQTSPVTVTIPGGMAANDNMPMPDNLVAAKGY